MRIDNSTNQLGNGGANIGGLIGVASLNLEGCSAVTEIHVNCTHEHGSTTVGNYVRAGGLAGSANRYVTNCYSGGSIDVGYDTIHELYSNNKGKKLPENYTGNLSRDYNTHVYICGLTANTNRIRYSNFTTSNIGKVVVTNCYTYMHLPNMEGNIKGVSLISGVGDRYRDKNTTVTMNNCYYLKGIDEIVISTPKYYYNTIDPLEEYVYDENGNQMFDSEGNPVTRLVYRNIDLEDYHDAILSGDLTINAHIILCDNTYNNVPLGTPLVAVSYDELSSPEMAAR